MKKVVSFKGFSSQHQKDLIQFQFSTQITDSSQTQLNKKLFEIPSLQSCQQTYESSNQKLISRTNSVPLFKESLSTIIFEFFGFKIVIDSSDKQDAQQTLQKWLQNWQLSQEKQAQIKIVFYDQLSKRNIEFSQLLELALKEYAEIKIKQIQEQQIRFHKEFE